MSNSLCGFHQHIFHDYIGYSTNTCIKIKPCIWVVFILNKPTHFRSALLIHNNAVNCVGLCWRLIIPVPVLSDLNVLLLSFHGYNRLFFIKVILQKRFLRDDSHTQKRHQTW